MKPDSLPATETDLWASSAPAAVTSANYLPGTLLAGRYRIVALVGRGGMGEVYRADDLTLGQPVTLKFLPEHLGADASRLALLRNEVRVARQLSHPSVCRIYDIGEKNARQDSSLWFWPTSVLLMAALVATALWSFRRATRGRGSLKHEYVVLRP